MTERVACFLRRLFIFGVPIAQFLLFEGFIAFPLPDVYAPVFLSALLFILLIDLLAALAFGSLHRGYAFMTAVFAVFGFVTAKIQELRGVPFQISDLRSVRTAALVANGYDLSPSARSLIVLACFALLFALCLFACRIFHVPCVTKWHLRLVAAAACTMGALGCWSYFGYDFSNRLEMGSKYGPVYGSVSLIDQSSARDRVGTFAYLAGRLKVDKLSEPDGYAGWDAPDDVFEIGDVDLRALPDIVVVMNEAFSDPGLYSVSVTDQDYMPFLHSFSGAANARLGTMSVSVLGGNTANTEFEFLTGASMAYFPAGSVPYTYAVNRDVPSLVRYLSMLGYETWAVHPYYASGWNREAVYSYMGFDNLLFYDMPCGEISFADEDAYLTSDADILSDQACYDTIFDILNTDSGKPKFVFLVTMYNHGGYERQFPGLERMIQVSDNMRALVGSRGADIIETYLSLMCKSDMELEMFCDALLDRAAVSGLDSLVLFFGDHQPDNTVHGLFDALADYVDPDGDYDDYIVPYGMWATYDLDIDSLSGCACYAGIDVFDAIGSSYPGYYGFLADARDGTPVLTSVRKMSPELVDFDRELSYLTWDRICAEK